MGRLRRRAKVGEVAILKVPDVDSKRMPAVIRQA